MKKLMVLGMAMVFSIAATAQWGKKVKGNGNVVTIDRTTSDYDVIALAGFFDVDLVDGNEGNITLNGEENILKHIKTEVKNGKLLVKVEKGINLNPSKGNSVRITIPVERISGVSLSGSGDITGKKTIKNDVFKASISGSGDIDLSLDANDLNVSISGSGDIKLAGNTKDLNISVSGSGDIMAYALSADSVNASISGSADVEVTANKAINARVSGSGDITYKGNPDKVNNKTSGSGSISKG